MNTNIDIYGNEFVRILNPAQAHAYIKNGAKVVDVVNRFDDKMVFIFRKDETKELYHKWSKYELH